MAETLKKCPTCQQKAPVGKIKLHKVEDKSVITSETGKITRGFLMKELFKHDEKGNKVK